MFNYSYFKYLFKSKAYLLIFTLILSLLISLTNTGKNYLNAYVGLIAICIALCYALPCLVFSFVHNKKAVDSYYSLDIDRKSLLLTGLAFCFVSILIIYTLNSLIIYFSEIHQPQVGINTSVKYGIMLRIIFMAFAFLTLLVYNTTLYLTANTVFDGLIVMAAHTVLPLAIYYAGNAFIANYVYGYSYDSLDFIGYLSPVFMVANLFHYLLGYDVINNVLPITLLMLLIFLLISYIFLYRSFKKRKVERAGTISNSFLSYPLIINVYAFACIFTIACDSHRTNILAIFSSALLLYVLVFALYMVAHFIYLRKLSLNVKTPIIFILIVALCLLFTNTIAEKLGYSLSKTYIKDDNTTIYDYNVNYWDSEEVKNSPIRNWVIENIPETSEEEYLDYASPEDYRYMTISITNANAKSELSKEIVDLFEKIRFEAIERHYEELEKIDIISDDGMAIIGVDSNLRVNNVVRRNNYGSYESLRQYNYHNVYYDFSLEDLIKLSYENNLDITIWYEDAELKISKNFKVKEGKLIAL